MIPLLTHLGFRRTVPLNGALKVLFSDPGRYKIKEPAAGPQRGLFIPSGPTLAEKNMKPKRGC